MARDVVVIGATIAGLTAARRLASEGFDVVVVDPNPPGVSAAIGHGVAACAHASTVTTMAAAYGAQAVHEHVRRNLAGIEEIRSVAAAGGVVTRSLPLHDHSVGAALDRELSSVTALLREAGAEVRPLTRSESRRAGAGLVSDAIALDPGEYAAALELQAVNAGAEVHHDVTVTHLQRRDGVSVVSYRTNVVWSREQAAVHCVAVIDTLGVSPWGRFARVGQAQLVPVLRFAASTPVDVVTLLAGPPVWMIRPDGDDVLAFGPKTTQEGFNDALAQLERWATGELGAERPVPGRMLIDPSDHGRPVVGASAIPGGFYTRGNGRGELMNGTASGCYLAALLLGSDASAQEIALPLSSKLRAQARSLGGRLLGHRPRSES